ncbi:Polyadenylate-binding protein-interacting protein [Thalictrum thalictroides]|uniref:Polyadenylate-binding protein-interacting protein n=1 Tax=Thalictrum thalictroides TaxID=46969 RepID=A0A7J6USQ2_THATH|nr:Polyadenylate-binding protein-interacting protein [Thalictrum thalictroides]
MSIQQVVQSRPSSNGFGRRKVERDLATRLDSKLPSGKSNSGSFSNAGSLNGKVGTFEGPSRDRFIYMTTCLIGHPVDVQVMDGSIYSGIFHATNTDEEFGVILKMARLIKDVPFKVQKLATDSVGKGLAKIMVIPAKDLVQVIAKDVAVSGNEMIENVQHEKRQDIMIDSYISQGFVEAERELERWAPDEDDPQCPELENIFDGPWNRHWDQFETNAALFGVKSTFDEELYTTKLERGPQMREREREASRIAKEIEGEDTQDLHMKEERGFDINADFGIDEETRFSSVFRGISDNGYEENEDTVLDSHNTDTFGGSSRSFSDVARRKNEDGTHASSSISSLDEAQLPQATAGRDMYRSASGDYARQLDAESRMNENQFREQQSRKNGVKEFAERKTLIDVSEDGKTSKFFDIKSALNTKKSSSDKGGLSPSATAYAPSSSISSKDHAQTDSLGESSDGAGSRKAQAAAKPGNPRGRPGSSASATSEPGNPRGRPGSSASSTSERAAPVSASSGPGLSPSSSMGSLSSEKSTLNPYAKEFKLNPNAKSFTPTQTPLRPSSPISDVSYYFPANVSTAPHMHGVPVGIGLGPSYGGPQSVVYNPQATPVQGPQAYIHPNGPLYGQQMIIGHPRQVLYMPNYPPDMPYKGRDF